MAVENPYAEQNLQYSAEQLRRGTYSPMLQRGSSVGSVIGGLVGSGDFLVTVASGLNLSVAVGEAVVPGSSSASQSGYLIRGTSTTSVTCAGNQSSPRIDLVYLQANDAAYTGSTNNATCAIATGTPTAGTTLSTLVGAPSLPTSALALAYALVPATSGAASVLNVASLVKPNLPALVSKGLSGSYTLVANDLYVPNTPGLTATLPAPTQGVTLGVFNVGGTAASPTMVTASSGDIYGPGAGSASSILLGASDAFVVLTGTGTNWLITAGQQDTGWIPLSTYLTNSWASAGGPGTGATVAAFRKQGNIVRFGGEVASGSSTTMSTAIPAAYRPTYLTAYAVPNSSAGQLVEVTAAGVLLNSSSSASAFLDVITYATD